jgi:molybdenum cofactor cytidylyltransferase
MGHPKALLDFHGETFLDRLIRLFAETCSSVTVVLGAEAPRIREGLLATRDAQFIVNEDWGQGQFSSLQTGLRAVPQDVDAVLFKPVDHPAIRPDTVAAVCRTANSNERSSLVIPRHQGRNGHPVLFRSSLISEFLALPLNALARDVVHKYVDQTIYVDVDDPGILKDADDRRAYEEIVASHARNV